MLKEKVFIITNGFFVHEGVVVKEMHITDGLGSRSEYTVAFFTRVGVLETVTIPADKIYWTEYQAKSDIQCNRLDEKKYQHILVAAGYKPDTEYDVEKEECK